MSLKEHKATLLDNTTEIEVKERREGKKEGKILKEQKEAEEKEILKKKKKKKKNIDKEE